MTEIRSFRDEQNQATRRVLQNGKILDRRDNGLKLFLGTGEGFIDFDRSGGQDPRSLGMVTIGFLRLLLGLRESVPVINAWVVKPLRRDLAFQKLMLDGILGLASRLDDTRIVVLNTWLRDGIVADQVLSVASTLPIPVLVPASA